MLGQVHLQGIPVEATLAAVEIFFLARSWAGAPIVLFASASAFTGAVSVSWRGAKHAAAARDKLPSSSTYLLSATLASTFAFLLVSENESLLGVELFVRGCCVLGGVLLTGMFCAVADLAKLIYTAAISKQEGVDAEQSD